MESSQPAAVPAPSAPVVETERVHHDYSPSTLQNLEVCPCYQGRESEHVRTIIGTISHGVAESGEDDNRLDDEDAAKVAECLDFYEGRRGKMVVDSLAVKAGSITEIKEAYLPIDNCQFDDRTIDFRSRAETRKMVQATTAGYVDAVIIGHDGTYAEMFDWKFGFWSVEKAESNLQGIAYALGLFRRNPKLMRIQFWFKQPNLDYVTGALFHRTNIAALYLRVQVVVARARAARTTGSFDTANATFPTCNFCANIGVCPKVTSLACQVGHKFYPLEIPESITPTEVHSSRNVNLGMRLAQVLNVWCGAFRRQVTDRVIRRDADVPEGFIIQMNNPRKIVNQEAFRAAALTRMTEFEYQTTLDTTFGAVEKIITEKAPRGSKKAAVEEFNNLLETSGAVQRGTGYSFLKASPKKPEAVNT